MTEEEQAIRKQVYKTVADEIESIASAEWGKRWIRGMSDPELGKRILGEIVDGLRRAGHEYEGKK